MGWRESLIQTAGAVPEDAEALAGDVDLLVPIEPGWRAADFSGGFGARACVLAHRGLEVFAVAEDPDHLEIIRQRGDEERPTGSIHPRRGSLSAPPALARGTLDLLLHRARASDPWANLLPLLRPGGWMIWFLEAPSPPRPRRGPLPDMAHTLTALAGWLPRRLGWPRQCVSRLTSIGMEEIALYIHPREYVWGYVPFHDRHMQQYYLESIQEEALGVGRGRGHLVRLFGRLGLYPYLASAYVITARKSGAPMDPPGRRKVPTCPASQKGTSGAMGPPHRREVPT